MGVFFGALFIFLLFTYLDAPNLREIGMDRDEIKEHQRGNLLIVLVVVAIIGVLSIPYWLLYQIFPDISYFWYLVVVIGGGIYWLVSLFNSKPK